MIRRRGTSASGNYPGGNGTAGRIAFGAAFGDGSSRVINPILGVERDDTAVAVGAPCSSSSTCSSTTVVFSATGLLVVAGGGDGFSLLLLGVRPKRGFGRGVGTKSTKQLSSFILKRRPLFHCLIATSCAQPIV